jgi:hypothetical protein
VVSRTAKGALLTEYERFMTAQANPAGVTWAAIHHHLRQAFLGPDEEEALIALVGKMRQGGQESIPDYNRRFQDAADDAYPGQRQPAIDRELVSTYLKSLKSESVVHKICDMDPRVVTLDGAIQQAYAIHTRLLRRDRILHEESDMEIGASGSAPENTIRQSLQQISQGVKATERKLCGFETTMAKLDHRLAAVETKVGKGAMNAAPPAAKDRPRGPPRGHRRCFRCGSTTHVVMNCPQHPKD